MIEKFKIAVRGVMISWQHKSILLQWFLAGLTVIAGFLFHLTAYEWIAVVICIGAVITAETLNTCIEKLCDLHTLEWNADVKYIKDIAAGAVLIASIAAFITAMIILCNHL